MRIPPSRSFSHPFFLCCFDLPARFSDDPTCLENAVYELVCCPDSSGVDNCDFCPDGVEFPNAVIFNDDRADAETINCAQGVIM
jgi:hypothetical protein